MLGSDDEVGIGKAKPPPSPPPLPRPCKFLLPSGGFLRFSEKFNFIPSRHPKQVILDIDTDDMLEDNDDDDN